MKKTRIYPPTKNLLNSFWAGCLSIRTKNSLYAIYLSIVKCDWVVFLKCFSFSKSSPPLYLHWYPVWQMSRTYTECYKRNWILITVGLQITQSTLWNHWSCCLGNFIEGYEEKSCYLEEYIHLHQVLKQLPNNSNF